MIDVTFHVWCDGEIDEDPCEAEFFHDQIDSLGKVADLRRQIDQRGWRVLRLDHGKTRLLCPLHANQKADR